ncbi:carbonic anhydrase [Bifidobacterium commune]|nr:carbonic anhydrase [Bifidobacterium commune]
MLQGNARFACGGAEHPRQDKQTRESLIDGQHPDAAVLSCSDSRVPPEILFDQGLGDMFTVRTAGQILDDAVIGSLEYAVTNLGVSLLVVLGHEHCGAIGGVVAQLDIIADNAGIDLGAACAAEVTDSAIIDPVTLNENSGDSDADDVFDIMNDLVAASDSILVRSAGASILAAREARLCGTDDFERVHIARTIEALVNRSDILQQGLASQRLTIVGARYLLTTGEIEVLSF